MPMFMPGIRRLLLIAGVGLTASGAAATAGEAEPISGTAGGAEARAVVNFADLAISEALAPCLPEAVPGPQPVPRHRPLPPGLGEPSWAAPVPSPPAASPSPKASFAALPDDGSHIPPDTHGAAGPNHLVVALNGGIGVQDRSGALLQSVTLNGFWASLASPLAFDPRVLYDPYADRFMIVSVANRLNGASAILIGVTQSGDPTGAWNLYRIDADPDNVQNKIWPDYPGFGFNKDWIVVDVNMFQNPPGNSYVTAHVYAFDKAALYAGTGANHTLFRDFDASVTAPAVTYDNTLASEYLMTEWNATSGALRIASITGAVGAEIFTWGGFVAGPSGWTTIGSGSGLDFAPQLGSARKIQTGDSRLVNVVYRGGSLWAAHTVFLPLGGPWRSAVQWWQASPAGSLIQFGRLDDATGAVFRAFPSIAVNKNGDALVSYARFSASTYASGAYAFRAAADAAGMLQSELVFKPGLSPYDKDLFSGQNRWGDYSATAVDPVDDLSFWSIQEYADLPASTWGTWWVRTSPPVCPAPGVTAPTSLEACLSGAATFSVTANGQGPFTYGWRQNSLPLVDGIGISGATTNRLTLDPVGAGSAGGYDVVVRDVCGQIVASAAATLTLAPAPQVSSPADLAVCAGAAVGFAVTASGKPPFTYRWRKDGLELADGGNISGSATDNLSLAAASSSDAGAYDVLVTDACLAAVVGGPAQLSVGVAPVSPANTLKAVKTLPGLALNWPAAGGASTYDVHRCDASLGSCVPALWATVPTPGYADPSPTATILWYTIAAVNACGTTP